VRLSAARVSAPGHGVPQQTWRPSGSRRLTKVIGPMSRRATTSTWSEARWTRSASRSSTVIEAHDHVRGLCRGGGGEPERAAIVDGEVDRAELAGKVARGATVLLGLEGELEHVAVRNAAVRSMSSEVSTMDFTSRIMGLFKVGLPGSPPFADDPWVATASGAHHVRARQMSCPRVP